MDRSKLKPISLSISFILTAFLLTILFAGNAIQIAYASELKVKSLDEIERIVVATSTSDPIDIAIDALNSSDLLLWYQENDGTKDQGESVKDLQQTAAAGDEEIKERVDAYEAAVKAKAAQNKTNSNNNTSNNSNNSSSSSSTTKTMGTAGRLTIPSVGVDVALYYGSQYDGDTAQAIVDRKDSAVIYTNWGVNWLIADHVNQGFSAMKNSVPGSTVAYIDNGTTTTAYVCTKKCNGTNTGSMLLDSSGNSVHEQNSGGLVMYTCNSNWQNVTITFWQPA